MKNLAEYTHKRIKEIRSYQLTQWEDLAESKTAYHLGYRIAKDWLADAKGRKADMDTNVPFYLKLKMNTQDDLCKECMLFLEDMEEKYAKSFKSTALTYSSKDYLVAFNTGYLRIIFVANETTKCVVLEDEKEETVISKVNRRVVCV